MGKVKYIHYAGYGLGDLANGLTFGMTSTFLLSFYTDVLGITAAAAGTLFLAARIWDGINDPLMGNLADWLFNRRSARSRKGDKFRPFLLRGSWPVAAAAVLVFSIPAGLAPGRKLLWACATYIAWGMCYTFVNIPYGSLAAVMTRDPVERSLLSVSRGIGGLAGVVLPRIIVPLILIRFAGRQERGYRAAIGFIGLTAVLFYILSWAATFEDPDCRTVPLPRTPRREGPPGLLKNRPFLALSLASVAMLTGMMVNGAMNIYYFREVLNSLEHMAYAGIVAAAPAAAAALAIPRLVRRFGSVRTSAFSSLISALCWIVLFLLPPRPWLYLGGSLIAYLFLMIPNMTIWALVSDCIDYQEELTGERREGTIYGYYSFIRKTGQALAGFLSGAGLALSGYDANLAQQSFPTREGIKFITLAIPASCLFLTWLSYRFLWNMPPRPVLDKGETS